MDDSDLIQQILKSKLPEKASQADVDAVKTKQQNLRTMLNNYVATLDAAIAATDDATAAVVSARANVDADGTVNASLKAELRALENVVVKLMNETRLYRTAFAWIRDNY